MRKKKADSLTPEELRLEIRNEYINGSISQLKLAKKYGVPKNTVKNWSVEEGWVEQKKKQRAIIAEKVGQKTAEKIAEKASDNNLVVHSMVSDMLHLLTKAVQELNKTELRNKHQVKTIKDAGEGERVEETDTKEYIERVECVVNLDNAQKITSIVRDLMEINLMVEGNTEEISSAFDELMTAIGGTDADH